MLVVPLEKDRLRTVDGQVYRVLAYTNYKPGGPAVYARAKGSREPVLVYFFDIDHLNGVKVEYLRGPKVFRAYGRVERKFHLPQPDDKVTVLVKPLAGGKPTRERVDVVGLKLKARSLGVNKGLLIIGSDGHAYRLGQLLDIERALGGERFDSAAFLDYYADYAGA